MEEILTRIWNDLLGRASGPLTLRLYLQPTMAIIFAIRDGLKDAREGRPYYFYSLFTDPANRAERLREGLKAVGKVLVMAIILDLVYEFIVFRRFYPGETLIVAFLLAFVPYLLMRGPVNRIARQLQRRTEASDRRAGGAR